MHNIVEVDTFSANVSAVDDGDAASAANFTADTQQLSNRTRWLYNRTPAAVGIVHPVPIIVVTSSLSRFIWGTTVGGSEFSILVNSDTTDAGLACCVVTGLPMSGTITQVQAMVTGIYTAGAHGGLVGTAPSVAFARRVMSTGVITVINTTNDPYASTDLGLYEAPHAITSAACAEQITNDRVYVFRVTGENGANKANDKFAVYGFKVTIVPA